MALLKLQCLGVYLFSAALCGYLQFQTPYLPETDGYFHAKFAWLMREQGLFLNGFPWAYFSLWRDGFSDGSLLFHMLLIPFTFGNLALGVKLATVLLSAGVFTSFFAILSLNGVRGRYYWLWLLMLGGGIFWWRMMVPRPQVLSVILLLWSTHFLINSRARAFALMSFVYPLSYVAAFLPQLFAALRWAYLKLHDGRSEHKIFLAGSAAYVAAMLLHPYFPNNVVFFYVQNVFVLFSALTDKADLFLGGELFPMDTREMLGAHFVLLAHLGVLAYFFMHRPRPLSERTRVLFLITLLTVLLTCGSLRFVEYSVPLATLFCSFFAHDLLQDYGEKDLLRSFPRAGIVALRGWLLAMGIATGVMFTIIRAEFAGIGPPHFESLARVIAEKVPPGQIVFVCDWDEPPELFFFDHQHRYPVMMDPTFMYFWDRRVWQSWSDVSNGRLSADDTIKALTETFSTRYGFCGRRFEKLRQLVGKDKRFRIVAEDKDGYIFELDSASKSSMGVSRRR